MIRLLILALLGFLVYTLYSMITRSLTGGSGSIPREKSRQGEDMVRDPQCGTYVPRGDALEKTVNGKTYYFCSARCRDEFTGKKS